MNMRMIYWYAVGLPIRLLILGPFALMWRIGELSEQAVWYLDKFMPGRPK